MGFIERYFPKTDNFLLAGIKLALLDLVFLTGSGVIAFALFSLVGMVRRVCIPIPLQLWLFSLFLVIPYYVFCFEYGRAYGSRNKTRRVFRGFLVGFLGHTPNFALLFVLIQGEFYKYFDPQIWRIIFTMLEMISIVAPIMVVLGATDRKQK